MIDEAAVRRRFFAFDAGRPMTQDDLLVVMGGAVATSHSTGQGWRADDPQDMGALALMFGIKAWNSGVDRPDIYWPMAEEGTHAFSFNLLWQMSESDPDGPFLMLRKLPLEQANPLGERQSDLVGIAFAAGLAVGVNGKGPGISGAVKAHLESRARVNEMLAGFTKARKTAQ